MLANRVIFVLLLAVFGNSGCSTVERVEYLSVAVQPQSPSATPVTNNFPDLIAHPSVSNSPPVAIADSAISNEPSATLPTVDEIEPAPAIALPKAKPAREEVKEKTSTMKNPRLPAAQNALIADNRLLELLEKDLDRAVEQPPERRRLQFSKEVLANPKVRHFVKYFSTTAKRRFQELLERSGKYMPMIAKVLNQEGLPEELGYLALIESEFVVNTTSPSGAVGLWQFVAGTARRYGLRIDEWVDERRDPVKSTRAAAAYLKDLHEHFGRWYLATAAYNAGPGTINKAMKSSGAKDFWSLSQKASLSEETGNFVPKFVAIVQIANEPAKFGFQQIAFEKALDYEQVEVPFSIKLETLAELSESDAATLRELNPALLRNTTPLGEPGFRVNLPVGKSAVYLAKANNKLQENNLETAHVVTHEVRKGETLLSIARRYGQEVRALMELNGLTTARLRIGQKLRILLEGIRALR